MKKSKTDEGFFSDILIDDKGSIKRFLMMLKQGNIPYLWIIGYIILSFALTNVGINVAEYTAEMYSGNVAFVSVVLPFLIFKLVSLAIASISTIILYICKARIDRNLQQMVWRKIVKLPMNYYEDKEPKELLSRITTDVTVISTLITQVFIPIITSIYAVYAMLRKLDSYDSKLVVTLVVLMPVYLLIAIMLGRLKFGTSDLVSRKRAALTRTIAEKVNNILLIKSFNSQDKESQYSSEKMKNLYKADIKNSWIAQFGGPIMAIAGVLQVIVIIFVGRGFYSNGIISLAQWIVYFEFANTIANNVSGYCGYWSTFKASQGATNRVSKLVFEADESLGGDKEVEELHGDICFKDVDFSIGDKVIFDKLSLRIPTNNVTAIIGESGSGKTTLLNLIERFYNPRSGEITIGNEKISDYTMKGYREMIAYVTQESMMFSGTIRENILYGIKRAVSDEEIHKACREANAYEFIHEFKDGYETQVGEEGNRLSGGQKQRISIARAILKNPRYLLLDEATAAMDIKAKDEVWTGITNLMKGRTTIFVAHDKQTVLNAEYVIVMGQGQVIDAGSREELMNRCDYYQEFMGEKAYG